INIIKYTEEQYWPKRRQTDKSISLQTLKAIGSCKLSSSGMCSSASVRAAGDAELRSDGFERLDHEGDVFVQVDAQLLGAVGDIVAVDVAGESFVLHLFANSGDIYFVDALAGADESHGGDEPG